MGATTAPPLFFPWSQSHLLLYRNLSDLPVRSHTTWEYRFCIMGFYGFRFGSGLKDYVVLFTPSQEPKEEKDLTSSHTYTGRNLACKPWVTTLFLVTPTWNHSIIILLSGPSTSWDQKWCHFPHWDVITSWLSIIKKYPSCTPNTSFPHWVFCTILYLSY